MDEKKYKWFYTKSEKLVVGGKNAESNDSLLNELNSTKKDYILMHTKAPGSPFCAIISPIDEVTPSDIQECAVFTGCFSKAWKMGLKKTVVDMFHLSQVKKNSEMKSGSWAVAGKIQTHTVELELVLIMQKKIVRAVPKKSANSKDILAYVFPGKIDKSEVVNKINMKSLEKISRESLIASLPAGGVVLK
ncbi:DUF814 domain-containing protein [Candidatus Pacearchaeota archaeon]|nr:DUF814 domain-containing protein [Candidatus Pacearchaeota archaeon]